MTPMTTKRNIHKTFLLTLLVIAPLWWLLMTEDGQRRADAVLLRLSGDKAIELNLKALDGKLSEQELQQVYPDLPWQCVDAKTSFGTRVCSSPIGTYNGLPARMVSVFFGNGQITVLKLDYRESYHAQLTQQLQQQLGQPLAIPAVQADGETVGNLLKWQTPHGTLVMKQTLGKQDESALLWLAVSN